MCILQEADIYKVLNLYRRVPPTEAMQELVVVTCCAPGDNNNNPMYTNKSAAMLTITQTQPGISINWTAADSKGLVIHYGMVQQGGGSKQ